MLQPSTKQMQRLEEHRRRRHSGQGTENARFVVQLHQAQRRHFDLRLEVGGSLRSWAVPRGPSLDAEQKRLAVEVEDHPLVDEDFEQQHTAAHAAVGSVAVWDQGHWQPDNDPVRGLADGRLGFTLYGHRLHGRWSLIRTDMRGDLLSKPQWLLVKARDSWVRSGDVADDQPLCVVSSEPEERDEPAQRRPLPGTDDLQLIGHSPTAPAGDEWLHEVKLDGYRLLIQRSGDDVRLLSRNNIDWASRLPHLVAAVRALRCKSAVLDAELIALDRAGRSDFHGLQQQMARDGDPRGTVALAFDLLSLDRRDLRKQPQIFRKRELARLITRRRSPLRVSDFIVGDGPEHFRAACSDGFEGIVSKRCDAVYHAGRRGAWLKIKCVPADEFAVIGYIAARDSEAALSSLLLARPSGDRWQYAGRVDSGFSDELLAGLPARLKPRREPPALNHQTDLAELHELRPVWVSPTMIVEAQYRGVTDDGLLQDARLKTIRDDKTLADLQPLDELPAADSEPTDAMRAAPLLTDPERTIFVEPPISRRQVADFYGGIAEWLMPGLRNRPISLLRCPDGVGGSCCFESQRHHGFPRSVRETRIVGRHGRSMKVLYIDDVDGLIGLVQMDTIEIHPWGASLNDIEHPDQLVFDLDPGADVAWSRVVAAAREVRDHLHGFGLQSFVRTSGGKGLHLVVPLRPKADWQTARNFARDVARVFAARLPRKYTDLVGERNRKGRIFIDSLRNSRGASSIASYSLRAHAGAPVATPLNWSELGRLRSATQHDYDSLPKRLARLRGDPWGKHLQLKQTLPESTRETNP